MANDRNDSRRTVIFFFSTTDFTGAAKMGYHFARAFQTAGYTVIAVCGPRVEGSKVVVMEPLRECGIRVIEENGFESFFNRSLFRRIQTLLREERPAAVVCMFNSDTKLVAWAARGLRIPFFISAQNRNTFFGRPPLPWIKERIYALTLRLCATQVVCTSEVVKQEFVSGHRVPERLISVLPNGIDTKSYRPGAARREDIRASLGAGIGPDDLLCVNVGRIDSQKGQDVSLRAFAKVTAPGRVVRLLFIGEPSAGIPGSLDYAAALKTLAAELGVADRVHFVGWRSDVPDVLRACDVYVHSSIWEGWALAPLEAMASSMPVVMTDCSGSPNGFVHGADGYIVPTGKDEPLAAAMQAALRLTDAERAEMGRRARQLVEREYDIEQIGQRFVELIESSC